MRFTVTIMPNGEKITEVIERDEQEECSMVKQFTNAIGRETSDEITGPECDRVEEIIDPG